MRVVPTCTEKGVCGFCRLSPQVNSARRTRCSLRANSTSMASSSGRAECCSPGGGSMPLPPPSCAPAPRRMGYPRRHPSFLFRRTASIRLRRISDVSTLGSPCLERAILPETNAQLWNLICAFFGQHRCSRWMVESPGYRCTGFASGTAVSGSAGGQKARKRR